MHLNHLNLVVADIAQMTEFFERFLSFRCLDRRGEALAVLEGADGFLLVLMRPPISETAAYPVNFHVGFYVDSEEAVRAKHAELRDAGLEPDDVQRLQRAAAPTFTFYCRAPSGLLVEVSSRA